MIDTHYVDIELPDGRHRLGKFNDDAIVGPVDYGLSLWEKGDRAFVIGGGIIAGSILPGSNRLVITANSPVWDGFFVSTIGGAALIWDDLGVNLMALRGRARTPSVLLLHRSIEKMTVEVHPVDVEAVWRGYQDLVGYYALQKWVWDRFKDRYKKCRILATGPSALYTNMGAIGSAPVMHDGPGYVDTWAGRGGMGSQLLREHNIAAIIYGGVFVDEDLRDRAKVDSWFMARYNKTMMQRDFEVTAKYRFEPKFLTGGTFGSNMSYLKDLLLMMNYSSIYLPDDERMGIYTRFVQDHYLKQFNEETIQRKQWNHCGEPCAVVCKKNNGKFKKDYEPYQALGPNAGIFDQRAAEKINYFADGMAFDAIQIGGVVSWVFESIATGRVDHRAIGLSAAPKWDLKRFDVVADSMHNADLGIEVITKVLHDPDWAPFREGIRVAAHAWDARFGTRPSDLACYNLNGDGAGCMVPNQYWVPGMFSPMPIMGKYYEYYQFEYHPPRELAKKNVERMVKELYSDNGGICRFHRGWAEDLIQDIVNNHYGLKLDYVEHHKQLSRRLNAMNRSRPWENERVVDLMKTYHEKVQRDGPKVTELDAWVERFRADKWAAARAYWQELREGLDEALAPQPAASGA